jgi:hypothetical protein
VREAWSDRIGAGEDFALAARCEGEEGFVPSFRYAARLEAGEAADAAAQRAEARRIVACLTGEVAGAAPGEPPKPY